MGEGGGGSRRDSVTERERVAPARDAGARRESMAGTRGLCGGRVARTILMPREIAKSSLSVLRGLSRVTRCVTWLPGSGKELEGGGWEV